MINYDSIKHSPALFRTFTGLTPSEFDYLLVIFKEAWKNHIALEYADKKDRKRKYGGGRKPNLLRDEDKLLFILIYYKIYPLQAVFGFLFGMSQSQTCEWIHRLSAVLKATLKSSSSLPERIPENLREILLEDGADEVAVDGTERRRQRPGKQKNKKNITAGKRKPTPLKTMLS